VSTVNRQNEHVEKLSQTIIVTIFMPMPYFAMTWLSQSTVLNVWKVRNIEKDRCGVV
jgi:hypothetical protein